MARPADPDLRARILDAAAPLFYAHGVQAVGMAQVVAAAGCGKNVLYRHFGSKDDLVAAYLADFGRQRDEAMQATLAQVRDPGEALVALTRDLAADAADPRFQGCAVRNYLREVRRADDAPGQVATALRDAWRSLIGDLTAELGVADPVLLADQICLVHDGVHAATGRDPARAGQVAVGLVVQLVEGALAGGE
ncbi:TetR/AcrR family transcriptional regulator [soil metagenome]